jgi:HlyD family secretion protein
MLVNNSALRFHPDVAMIDKLKPMLSSKARVLPDSIRATFLASLNSESPSTSFKRSLPGKYSGVFYMTDKKSVAFYFVELGITTGLQSEIKSFVGDSPLPAGSKIINGIKTNGK